MLTFITETSLNPPHSTQDASVPTSALLDLVARQENSINKDPYNLLVLGFIFKQPELKTTPPQLDTIPLDKYRQMLRLANWEAFNTSAYLELAKQQGIPVASQELFLDWLGYFGEHVTRLADQVHYHYTDRGINDASLRSLAEHTQNTIKHLRKLQQEKIKAANGKIYSPDRAIIEAEAVDQLTQLQKTNQWIIYLSPRGEKHHLYPGIDPENYVVVYVVKGNEFHQLMTWHDNEQLKELRQRLKHLPGAQEIPLEPSQQGEMTEEMSLISLLTLPAETSYEQIRRQVHLGKETWVMNPDDSLTYIDPTVVEQMAHLTGNILQALFAKLMTNEPQIIQAAGNLTLRQQLNLLTEVLQEKFASLAFQTQTELNQAGFDPNLKNDSFYQEKMQQLLQTAQTITQEQIYQVWLIRLKEESGQTQTLTDQEQEAISQWNDSIKIPFSFGRTASVLHCGIGTVVNPNMLKISQISTLKAQGFNLSQINLIREWEAKGYKLAQFEHQGKIIAYMVPSEYDLKKMYFDPNLGDVIRPCGVPLGQDPLAKLIIKDGSLGTSNLSWFNQQKEALVQNAPIDKQQEIKALLERIQKAVFVDTMGFDRLLTGDAVKNNMKARIVYNRLRKLLGNVAPHNLALAVNQLLSDEVLLRNLEELESELNLKEIQFVDKHHQDSGIVDVNSPRGTIFS